MSFHLSSILPGPAKQIYESVKDGLHQADALGRDVLHQSDKLGRDTLRTSDTLTRDALHQSDKLGRDVLHESDKLGRELAGDVKTYGPVALGVTTAILSLL